MTSINVDIGGLGALARRLKGLQREFEGMGDVMGDYHDAVGDSRTPPRTARYSDFVDLVHRCASDLQHEYRHIDAEKIEWLMFDRRNHRRVPEPCFDSWSS